MPMRWDDPTTPAPADVQHFRDPYLRWAEHTGWRGLSGQAGWDRSPNDDDYVQIIVRAGSQAVLDAALADRRLAIPSVYREPIPGTQVRALHFTAWVQHGDLAGLPCDPDFAWKLSQPLRDAEKVARGSTLGRFGETRGLLDFRAENVVSGAVQAARAKARRARRRAERPARVIAVIDFGCPFLNPCFAKPDAAGQTRIAAVWDQGAFRPSRNDPRRRDPGWPWAELDDMGYGREVGPVELQAMFAAAHEGVASEDAIYRGVDHLIDYDDARRRLWQSTHGAHVLDVVAGVDDPLTGRRDRASEASIVFVQLPSMTAGDSSGSSLAGHVLDAVRYVLARSAADARIVVNLSYGSRAGPHDGSSLLEAALDELLERRRDNFAIVLSAGNARRQRAHARRVVTPDCSALLRCRMVPGDTTDTFVETWYRPPPPGWLVRARARAVGGAWSPWVVATPHPALPREALLRATDGRDADAGSAVVGMLRHDAAVPNGGPSLLLLAAAPTAAPVGLDLPVAEAGLWEIEIALLQDDVAPPLADFGLVIDARIERDDPGQNAGADSADFIDQDAGDELDTLGSLATGRRTVVVGGFRLSDRREAEYSSVGPRVTDGLPPLVLAACEEDEVNPDIAAAAVRRGERFRMNGTSVAAPVLARRLYNRMGRSSVAREDWGPIIEDLADDPHGPVRLPP